MQETTKQAKTFQLAKTRTSIGILQRYRKLSAMTQLLIACIIQSTEEHLIKLAERKFHCTNLYMSYSPPY